MQTTRLIAALTLTIVLGVAGNSFAGGAKKALKTAGRPPALDHMHRVLEKMDLSPDQTTKITTILDQAESQIQSFHNDAKNSGDKSANKGKIKSLLVRTRTEIVEQLTPDQSKTFQEEVRTGKRGGVRAKKT